MRLQMVRKIIKAAGKEESVTLLKMNFEEFPAWVKEQTPKLHFQFILMDLEFPLITLISLNVGSLLERMLTLI